MWSSFLVNLEACRLIAGNFFIKWTPSQVFFDSILSSPLAPPMFWLKRPHQILRRPPMFATPLGNPDMWCRWWQEFLNIKLYDIFDFRFMLSKLIQKYKHSCLDIGRGKNGLITRILLGLNTAVFFVDILKFFWPSI